MKKQHSKIENGGQTTISPPAKVKSVDPPALILASGIDTLYLAINVEWGDDHLFTKLSDLKNEAISYDSAVSSVLPSLSKENDWPFSIKPYGTNGYEWLLSGREFTLKIGNWLKPKSRPSMLVEIGSETLWHLGAEQSVQRVLDLIQAANGRRATVKASRVDFCVDALLPESIWNLDLIQHVVTRAHDLKPHLKLGIFTGFSVGKGKLSARIYDKALEIQVRSNKFWMFDIWGLFEVPEGCKIIRTEFQLRRQAITELGLDSPVDVIKFGANAWKYFSCEWLKMQDRPGLHHTQRKTLPWWQVIQKGYSGAQDAHPLVRGKALRVDKKQIMQQAYGFLSSLTAIQQEELREQVGTE